jgi:hypothetical protein
MPTKVKARAAAAAVAGKNGHSLISGEKFRQLYAALVKYELLEERLGAPSTDAAGAVGITLDLEREDTVVLSPRTFAANFIKGVPIRALLDHRSSSRNGASFSYGAANAVTPGAHSAATQAGMATGAALTNKMAGNHKIAVAFLEGGAAALKECSEALELASAHKLPVIYVIHATPDSKLEKVLAEAAELVPVITVDAHDVVAAYRVAQESIERARDGGPSLIVCVPLRPNAAAENAVISMEQYLAGKKLFRNLWKDQALAEFNREITAACLPPADPLA